MGRASACWITRMARLHTPMLLEQSRALTTQVTPSTNQPYVKKDIFLLTLQAGDAVNALTQASIESPCSSACLIFAKKTKRAGICTSGSMECTTSHNHNGLSQR